MPTATRHRRHRIRWGLVVHLLTFPLQILGPVAITAPQNKCFNIWRNIVGVPSKEQCSEGTTVHITMGTCNQLHIQRTYTHGMMPFPSQITVQCMFHMYHNYGHITDQIKDFSWLILKKYSENTGTAEDSLPAVPVIISAFYTAPSLLNDIFDISRTHCKKHTEYREITFISCYLQHMQWLRIKPEYL
ncbi:hypothetical protein C8J57DRAFT_1235366 [Mycena rebaudengoi]|nr:hypothetical protein C8J57DRAFT_1235366 [Mycena rebaudengoi]